MSSFSGTGRSTNFIAWKRWFLSGTREYFSENFDGEAINWSGVVNVHCMQMSLVMSMRVYFRRWLKKRAMFVTFLVSGNDVISLELTFLYLYTRTQSLSNKIQKVNALKNTRLSIKKEVKNYYPVSCRINRLISYLISKQARLSAVLRAFLL